MGQLTNLYVSSSYQGLIKLADSQNGVTSTLQYTQDGNGNNLPIQISNTQVNITGSFTVNGSPVTSGSSGTSGTSGTSGSNGSSGTSGTSGSSGSSGTSGTSGSSGSSGTSGVNGTSGTSGSSGNSGSSGTSGSSGVSGSSGTSGSSGNSGSSGTSGNSGSSGTSGVNGSSGTSGTSGVAGSSGTSGTSGVAGSSGTSGTSGNSGSSGTSGTSGSSGVSGSSGTSGTSGATGSSGTSGTSGVAGSSGTSGTSPIVDTGMFATTGSNNFKGGQYITEGNGLTLALNTDNSGSAYPNIGVYVDQTIDPANVYASFQLIDANTTNPFGFAKSSYTGEYPGQTANIIIADGATSIGFSGGTIGVHQPTVHKSNVTITGSLKVDGVTHMSSSDGYPLNASGTIRTQRIHYMGNPFNDLPSSNLAAHRIDGLNESFNTTMYDLANNTTASYVRQTVNTGSNFVRTILASQNAGFDAILTLANYAGNGLLTSNVNTEITGTLKVTGSLTASGLNYPTTDGTFAGQVIQTDGAGNLSFGNVNAVFETIYNGEATTLTKGTPLYVSGSQGSNPKVYRANTSDSTKMPVTFVAMENIGTASTGRGITLGLITGIDMTGYPVGTTLWVDGLGALTSTRPTGAGDIVQPIGIVTKTGSGGQLNVLNPGPVLLPNLPSGELWIGDSSNQPVSKSISEIGFATTGSNTFNGNQIINGSVTSQINYVTYSGSPYATVQLSGSTGGGLVQSRGDLYVQGHVFGDNTNIGDVILTATGSKSIRVTAPLNVTSNANITGTFNVQGTSKFTGSINGSSNLTVQGLASFDSGKVNVEDSDGSSPKVAIGTGNEPYPGMGVVIDTDKNPGNIYSYFAIDDFGSGSANKGGIGLSVQTFTGYGSDTVGALYGGLNGNDGTNTIIYSVGGTAQIPKNVGITGSLKVTGSVAVTGSVQGNVNNLSVSSNTASLNLNNGNFFVLALTGSQDIRIEPSNIKPGQTINILLNTTGSGTVSFPTSVKQVSGSSYTPTTAVSKDIITLVSFDTTSLYLANVKNLI